MNILNFTNSKKVDKILQLYNFSHIKDPYISGVFLPTIKIKHRVSTNKRYSFIIIHINESDFHFHLLHSVSKLTSKSIHNILDMLEEFFISNQCPTLPKYSIPTISTLDHIY